MELSPGERIRYWRRIKDWTYRDLSEATGIGVTKLHKLEHGEREVKTKDMEAIASAFGLTVTQFYGAIGSDRPQAAAG